MSFPLKKLAMATVLTLVMTAGAAVLSAQPAPRDGGWAGMDRPDPERMEQRRQEMFEKMCEFLELDESQQKQAGELFDSRREEMKEMREQVGEQKLERKEARDKMRESFQQHRKQFESLLTEEQLGKLKLWEEQRRDRCSHRLHPGMEPDRRRGPGMAPGPDKHGRPGKFEPMGGVMNGLRHRLDLSEEQLEQLHKLTGEAIDDLFDTFAATLDLEQQEKLREMREHFKDRRDMRRDGPPGE